MPKDVQLARELAEKLSATYTGLIKSIRFTYDNYVELDSMPNEPVALVTLDNSEVIREGRTPTRRDASIVLTVISEVGPTDKEVWIDQYIDAFDALVQLTFDTVVLGTKPIDMESEGRYDVERFHSHRRLVMDATFNYRNL